MKFSTSQYKTLFLIYFNDFLLVDSFAEYLGVSDHEARVIINKGRVLHQDQFGLH